ncbi:MAG: hypothetical protein ACFCUU_07245 [Cyclobacteriaceae bacterium]
MTLANLKSSLGFNKVLLTIFTSFTLCACNQDTADNRPSIAGLYTIESLVSEVEVAIGNNRITSRDLMEQIEGFSYKTSFLVIRPNFTTDKNDNYKLITIPIPHPNITIHEPNSTDSFVIFTNNSLNGIGYTYEFNESTKTITLIRPANHQETEKEWGRLEEIHVVDDNTLKSIVTKKYYDFNSAEWKDLNITAIFKKAY